MMPANLDPTLARVNTNLLCFSHLVLIYNIFLDLVINDGTNTPRQTLWNYFGLNASLYMMLLKQIMYHLLTNLCSPP